ncbi:hypothetical protein AGMMS50256_07770 [Betaproteobacteria bacterium]|nr:hypothetical protein AGMMS50256_07770 [Betaproteobacteria bacterium]
MENTQRTDFLQTSKKPALASFVMEFTDGFGVYPETSMIFKIIHKKHNKLPKCHELTCDRNFP